MRPLHFFLLIFLACTHHVMRNRGVTAFAKDHNSESSRQRLKQRSPILENFQPMPYEETARQALGFVMKGEHKRHGDAMKKAGPALNAQKELFIRKQNFLKSVKALKEKAIAKYGPTALQTEEGRRAYYTEVERNRLLIGYPFRPKQVRVDPKALATLHETGKSVENMGAINKDVRNSMLTDARPLPNPTKPVQLGLQLVMKDQYRKHQFATVKQYTVEKIAASHNNLPSVTRIFPYLSPELVKAMERQKMQHEDKALRTVGVAAIRQLGATDEQFHADLKYQRNLAKIKVKETGNTVEKISMVNKGMRKYMKEQLEQLSNPSLLDPKRPKRKRKSA